jgi:hypothetical protein
VSITRVEQKERDRKSRHISERTRMYRRWSDMKKRCSNPKHQSWSRYGARGIKVCQRWMDSFDAFVADMGPRPTPEHTIDRIDNDGNYEPGNCRWATQLEQRQNQSYLQWVLHEGKPLTISQFRLASGMTTKAIYAGFKDGSVPECCKRGHLFTPDNLTVYHGQRWCKTCRRASERRSWEKRKPFELEYKRAYKARRRAQEAARD